MNSLETLSETFVISAKQEQFIQESLRNEATTSRIAIAMKTNSAFTVSLDRTQNIPSGLKKTLPNKLKYSNEVH